MKQLCPSRTHNELSDNQLAIYQLVGTKCGYISVHTAYLLLFYILIRTEIDQVTPASELNCTIV